MSRLKISRTTNWREQKWYAITPPAECLNLSHKELRYLNALIGWYERNVPLVAFPEGIDGEEFIQRMKSPEQDDTDYKGDSASEVEEAVYELRERGLVKLFDRKIYLQGYNGSNSLIRRVDCGYLKKKPSDFGTSANPLNMVAKAHLTQSLKQCSFPLGWTPEDATINSYQKSLLHAACKQFVNEDYRISFGKNDARMFSVVCPSRAFRGVVQINGQNLVNIDVKSCFPLLMVPIIVHPDEKEAYMDMILNKDTYVFLAPDTNRDFAKGDFMKLLAGKPAPPQYSQLTSSFTEYYPKSMDTIYQWKNEERSLPAHLQRLESDIMVRTIMVAAAQMGKPALIVHDGLYVLPEDVEWFSEQMIHGFKSIAGVDITLHIGTE